MCMSKRLSDNIAQWDKIGVTDEVKSWILNGTPVDFNDKGKPVPFEFQNHLLVIYKTGPFCQSERPVTTLAQI